jgi:hypothetical protein
VVFSFRSGAKLGLSILSLGFPSPKARPPHDPMGCFQLEAHGHGCSRIRPWELLVSNLGGLMYYMCLRVQVVHKDCLSSITGSHQVPSQPVMPWMRI